MATKTTPRLGPSMTAALDYVYRHPGCCAAEVDRARRTARGGHRWMYATVGRLIKAGMVSTIRNGSRADLYATDYGCERLVPGSFATA
jgi:predicted transcriptional regulator